MVLKFSTAMYYPTLGMLWSKDQVENRPRQVRNQNGSLIPDRQGVLLVVVVVVVKECVRACVDVDVGV